MKNLIILFIILRLLDIATTIRFVGNSQGYSELNPINRFFIQSYGLTGFSILNMLISLVVAFVIYKTSNKLIKTAFIAFLPLNLFVIVLNFIFV